MTIYITEREKESGNNLLVRILNYVESYVRNHNDLRFLDRKLGIQTSENYIFKGVHDGSYPEYVSMSERDYKLICKEKDVDEINEILGMKILVRPARKSVDPRKGR